MVSTVGRLALAIGSLLRVKIIVPDCEGWWKVLTGAGIYEHRPIKALELSQVNVGNVVVERKKVSKEDDVRYLSVESKASYKAFQWGPGTSQTLS
jgi:hypothetical protein